MNEGLNHDERDEGNDEISNGKQEENQRAKMGYPRRLQISTADSLAAHPDLVMEFDNRPHRKCKGAGEQKEDCGALSIFASHPSGGAHRSSHRTSCAVAQQWKDRRFDPPIDGRERRVQWINGRHRAVDRARRAAAPHQIGAPSNPAWVELNVASGGVALNGGSSIYGQVTATSTTGTVTVNSGALIKGTIRCDRFTINI